MKIAKDLPFRIPILLYHRVGKPKDVNDNMDPVEFERQMSFLSNEGYNTIDLDEYLLCLKGMKGLPNKPIIITFDDGAKNNYDVAFPIIKKYAFKAAIFVSTAYIGKKLWHSKEKRRFYFFWEDALKDGVNPDNLWIFEYLNWEQIIEMSEDNISFGAHTHTHPVLTKVSKKRLIDELIESKFILEQRLGKSIDYFSYPWGTFNKKIIELVKKAGFKAALAVDLKKKRLDLYSLERILIRTKWNIEDFKKALLSE